MSDLLPENYKDLLTYHTILRQFLSTSTVSTKPNPARAAKARDKLFKLSPSQFFELSTDVFDELQRRIGEATAEPDFLLPKSTFHPKRNEAREKLGLLQQTRFRDLVSDILYEVERREYHISRYEEKKEPVKSSNNAKGLGISHPSKNLYPEVSKNEKSNDLNQTGGVVTVQQSTVIPTKVDLAWSSDEEEEDGPNTNFQSKSVDNGHLERTSDVKPIHHAKTESTNSFASVASPKSNRSERDYVGELNNAIKNKHASGSGVARGLSVSKGRNKDREIELLLEEGTKMDKTITELEERNSLLQSKSEKFEQESQDLLKINGDLKDQIFNLEREVETKNDQIKKLYHQMETSSSKTKDLKKNSSAVNDLDVNALKTEVEQLKSKLNQYETGKIEGILGLNSVSEDVQSFEKLLSKNGLVPLPLVLSFRKLVHDFLIELGQNSKNKTIDSEVIFDLISQISKVSSKIASCASNTEKAELIRASISHAITSTRYYAIYGEALPSLVIESALSEVVFTVYDFLQDAKLNNTDFNGNSDGLDVSKNDITQSNRSFNSQKHIELTEISNGTEFEQVDDTRVSPVKPLRMTKRGENFLKTKDESNSVSKPLNLSLNTGVSNGKIENKSLTTPLAKTTGLASLVSKYSPDGQKKHFVEPTSTSSPLNDKAPTLRKSSSSNILSKVRQFEQQSQSESGSKTPSPVTKKQVVSPLQDSIVSQFGKRRSSLESLGKSFELPETKDNNSKVTSDNNQKENSDNEDKLLGAFVKAEILDENRGLAEPKISDDFKEDDDIDNDLLNNLNLSNLKKAIAKDTQNKPATVEKVEIEALELPKRMILEEPKKPEESIVSGVEIANLEDIPPISAVENNAKIYNEKLETKETINEGNEENQGYNGSSTITNDDTAFEIIEPRKSKDNLKDLGGKEVVAIETPTTKKTIVEPRNEVTKEEEEKQLESEEGSSEEESSEEEFDIEEFDIDNPDNTLSELLLYLEHQTVKVISTIQALLTSIKTADSTNGELRQGSRAINDVVSQMVEATSVSMNQSRNAQLKAHGSWVVDTLSNAGRRMKDLTQNDQDDRAEDDDYADKQFKQRLAGIAFDVAKCTKELVKTVEEANLKEEIEHLNKKLIK